MTRSTGFDVPVLQIGRDDFDRIYGTAAHPYVLSYLYAAYDAERPPNAKPLSTTLERAGAAPYDYHQYRAVRTAEGQAKATLRYMFGAWSTRCFRPGCRA